MDRKLSTSGSSWATTAIETSVMTKTPVPKLIMAMAAITVIIVLFFNAVNQLGFNSSLKDENADFMAEDNDYNTQIPAIAASIPAHITTISLAKFRRDGPFGKLHSIGVLLRKNSQLKQAFIAAQIAVNPGQQPLAWVHNVITRWSSNYAIAARVLQLRRALNKLFMNVKKQWINHVSVASQRPEILFLKLISSEWQIVTVLQHILKQFAIAIDQLQNDPLIGQPNIKKFNEYFPTIKLLLDHLKTAING
jgi:hypothetical protein